jgi:GNAT superfamily N-acetyltransferase
MTKDKIELALACINDSYIKHLALDPDFSSILIMDKTGKAFCRTYWYCDDEDTVYFDWLSVNESVRKQGIGNELLSLHEEIGKQLGANISFLFVERDSWLQDWYQRKGYVFYSDRNLSEIWMTKNLKNDIN